jgi:hypothetical protein
MSKYSLESDRFFKTLIPNYTFDYATAKDPEKLKKRLKEISDFRTWQNLSDIMSVFIGACYVYNLNPYLTELHFWNETTLQQQQANVLNVEKTRCATFLEAADALPQIIDLKILTEENLKIEQEGGYAHIRITRPSGRFESESFTVTQFRPIKRLAQALKDKIVPCVKREVTEYLHLIEKVEAEPPDKSKGDLDGMRAESSRLAKEAQKLKAKIERQSEKIQKTRQSKEPTIKEALKYLDLCAEFKRMQDRFVSLVHQIQSVEVYHEPSFPSLEVHLTSLKNHMKNLVKLRKEGTKIG